MSSFSFTNPRSNFKSLLLVPILALKVFLQFSFGHENQHLTIFHFDLKTVHEK